MQVKYDCKMFSTEKVGSEFQIDLKQKCKQETESKKELRNQIKIFIFDLAGNKREI